MKALVLELEPQQRALLQPFFDAVRESNELSGVAGNVAIGAQVYEDGIYVRLVDGENMRRLKLAGVVDELE